MRKLIAGIVGVFCLGLIVTAKTTAAEWQGPDPCVAAKAPVRYGTIIPVPAALRQQIGAYRQAWAAVCARKGGASLHALLVQAEAIRKAFIPILGKLSERAPDIAQIEPAHNQIQKVFATFVPAFEGSLIEFEYFSPSLDAFKQKIALGDADDRLFFDAHEKIFGNDQFVGPWIERTWDYGGCFRFGELDWAGHFAALNAVRTRAKGRYYLDEAQEATEDLYRMLDQLGGTESDPKEICTCKSTDAVLPDVDKILALLPTDTAGQAARQSLIAKRQRIETRKIELLSNQDKSCAGG